MKAPEAYRNTRVPITKSQEAIETLLLRYEADGVAFQSVRGPDRVAVGLRFRMRKKVYRLQVELGADPQEQRQRMRALYWGLKGIIEQGVFGIIRLEEALLAFAEFALPDGSTVTVGETILPQLEKAEPPSLEAVLVRALPAPRDGMP